jgi:crossover junction endodeoxyribonuclease RuvC
MIVFGVDPGLSGAVCALHYRGTAGPPTLFVVDMPVVEVVRNGKTKREVSAAQLADVFANFKATDADCVAYVERVGAMPGQGVSSVFSFGRSAGIVEGVLAALKIPVTIVTPQRWQKTMAVRDGKDGARLRAAELWPGDAHVFARKKDDGRADAALIAAAGARNHSLSGGRS